MFNLAAAMSLLPVHEDVAWLDIAAKAHQGQAVVFTPGKSGCSVGFYILVWDNKTNNIVCYEG